MRPILLTKHIEDLSIEYSKNLFSSRRLNFVKPSVGLSRLHQSLISNTTLSQDYKDYIDMIIKLYRILNSIQPKKYAKLQSNFFDRFDVDMKNEILVNGENKTFYKHICDAMRYDAVRDKDFLPYIRKLGIRACVYCNANYALALNLEGADYGKFELDHFRPQSKFPYLCTNFFNLNPCCSNCNKYKSDNEILFCLYTDEHTNLSPFEFRLDKRSIIKYMLHQDPEKLQIVFDPGTDLKHNTTFRIQATYNALNDVIEELIWKHKIYNPSYMSSLNDAFSRKFNPNGFHRFILGNYDQPQDIHKRPLAKLTQDIAKQLNIIK